MIECSRRSNSKIIAHVPIPFSVNTVQSKGHDGKHIGFVSAYFVDENFEWISFMDVKEDTKVHRALGIEICEPDYWCRGIGAKALSAFMQYHSEHGGSDYVLETWSGNHRMVKCAEKLGFSVCKRDVGIREVNGEKYDAITMILRKA